VSAWVWIVGDGGTCAYSCRQCRLGFGGFGEFCESITCFARYQLPSARIWPTLPSVAFSCTYVLAFRAHNSDGERECSQANLVVIWMSLGAVGAASRAFQSCQWQQQRKYRVRVTTSTNKFDAFGVQIAQHSGTPATCRIVAQFRQRYSDIARPICAVAWVKQVVRISAGAVH